MKTNRRVARWLRWRGWKIPEAARRLGCDRVTLWRIVSDGARPGIDLAMRLERLSSDWPEGAITAVSWGERSRRARAQAA